MRKRPDIVTRCQQASPIQSALSALLRSQDHILINANLLCDHALHTKESMQDWIKTQFLLRWCYRLHVGKAEDVKPGTCLLRGH